jgi:hypothetical protein
MNERRRGFSNEQTESTLRRILGHVVVAAHGLMLLAGVVITIKHLRTLKPARPLPA